MENSEKCVFCGRVGCPFAPTVEAHKVWFAQEIEELADRIVARNEAQGLYRDKY